MHYPVAALGLGFYALASTKLQERDWSIIENNHSSNPLNYFGWLKLKFLEKTIHLNPLPIAHYQMRPFASVLGVMGHAC